MVERATARNKMTWGLISILVLLSTALVVGCGGGSGGGGGGGGIASMGEARWGHTATLLADGRVLIAGGQGGESAVGRTLIAGVRGSDPIASAEVYDPITDTWTSAGSMTKANLWYTTTLLKDGRVLSVGDSSVDLYDPSTGTWTAASSPMYTRISGHTVTLLEDGSVLVAGGVADVDDTIRDVALTELYDPSTDEWTLTGDMTESREKHKAVLLKDGMVLVVGRSTAELYDPTTGTWSAAGKPSQGHGILYTMTLLADGRILVAGGRTGSHETLRPSTSQSHLQRFIHADIYDPSTGEWSPTADMTSGRERHTATLLKDGRVLLVESSSAELYDPATGVWTSAGKMSNGRGKKHTATLLEDGRVLIVGGAQITTDVNEFEKVVKVLASAEIYDPAKGW